MNILYKNNSLPLDWEIFKGVGNAHEDFTRALVSVFLTSGLETYPIQAFEVKNGVITFDTPKGLPEGAYSLKLVYIKNWQPYSIKRGCERGPIAFRHDSIMRAHADFVFAVTEYEAEQNVPTHNARIHVKSNVASYGYDGLDAFEKAVLRGGAWKNEEEWLQNSGIFLKTINGESLFGAGDISISSGSGTVDLSGYLTKELAGITYAKKTDLPNLSGYLTSNSAEQTYAKKTDIPNVSGFATQASLNGVNNKLGNVSSLQFDQTDNTITINGVKFDLVRHSDSPTPSEPTEPEYDYYVGQVDGSKSVFAAMTANDLVSNSIKQTSSLVNTTRVNKWIYYFMVPSGYNFASLEYTDGGIKTTVTDLADFAATHDDVVIGGKTYKVYGYRVSPNALDYKLVLTK